MKYTIYDIFIKVTSQEQSDRIRQLCIDYSLPIFKYGWNFNNGQIYFKADYKKIFWCSNQILSYNLKEISEKEFINLLRQTT